MTFHVGQIFAQCRTLVFRYQRRPIRYGHNGIHRLAGLQTEREDFLGIHGDGVGWSLGLLLGAFAGQVGDCGGVPEKRSGYRLFAPEIPMEGV